VKGATNKAALRLHRRRSPAGIVNLGWSTSPRSGIASACRWKSDL